MFTVESAKPADPAHPSASYAYEKDATCVLPDVVESDAKELSTITCPDERDDVKAYASLKNNKNTVKKTELEVQKFLSWIETRNEFRPLKNIPPAVLDNLIGSFILSLKKKMEQTMSQTL